MQLQKSEEYTQVLVENLNHQIFLQFVLPVYAKYGEIQLRQKAQFERMDTIVRNTLHSFEVDQFNIYDLENTISYSLNPQIIGEKDRGGAAYLNAVEGKTTSKLVQRGNFLEILFGFPKSCKIVTLAPLRAEKPIFRISGPVLGVVEIEQDLTQDYHSLFKHQLLVIGSSILIMGILFIFLLYVVKRGESIIRQRNLERMRLKEKLSRAERLSTLGEMVAKISHEIRNPLGIIRSSAELLKKRVLKFDPGNTIPDIIIEESTRLNSIITDYLDYARPKSPNPVSCHVNEILEKNINFLSMEFEKHHLRINKNYSDNLPPIAADSGMLYQAFLNIFLNAIQAMPDGGEITVTAKANEDFLHILFEDQGGGVPEDISSKIWDPFFTTKEMGTGLGLGIIKNIIESHGGAVVMKNRPEEGVMVSVQLPLTQEKPNGNRSHR
jgi:signal transduction histidine kinase